MAACALSLVQPAVNERLSNVRVLMQKASRLFWTVKVARLANVGCGSSDSSLAPSRPALDRLYQSA